MGDAASEDARIELAGVSKRFGPKQVLDDVSFRVAPGESFVVIGPSGCGKSVTVRCILGLLRHDDGRIAIDGAPLDRRVVASLRARSGMLFQNGALFDSLPVWRNVSFRLLQQGASRAAARETAIDRLRRVGLEPETADLAPSELSGGMQKRVAIARAIAADPEIMFFDEPTAGLDPILAVVVSQLIRRLVSELGATAVTITHDLASAAIIGDRAAMLYGGRLRWEGKADDIRRTDNPYVEQFVNGRDEGPIATVR